MPPHPEVRRAANSVLLATLVLLPACLAWEGSKRPAPVSEYLEGVAASLHLGDVTRAEDVLARARSRFPDDGGVRATEALLAQMQGRDEEAERDLHELASIPGRGGLNEAELSQRIGDLKFRAGRWRESASYLFRVPPGPDGDLRRALAMLTLRLPQTRAAVRSLAVERPLLPGPTPKLIVSVGGKDRALGLDTGASFTTLGAGLAKEIPVDGIQPAGTAVDGADQAFPVSVGVLGQLALGEVELGALPVLVVDDERLLMRDIEGGAESRVLGMLGQDVLLRFRLTIDGLRRSAIFEPSRGLPERQSLRCVWHEGRLLVPVVAEGRTLWMVLDTGASRTSLTDEGLATLPGGERRAVAGFAKLRGPGGVRLSVRMVKELAMAIGESRFSCPELPVVERGRRGVFPVHGVLGADLLMRCRLTLDRGRVKVSV